MTTLGKKPSLASFSRLPFVDLMVVIPSHGRELDRRNAIRQSWQRYSDSPRCSICRRKEVRTLFVVGEEADPREVEEEMESFRDLAILKGFAQREYYTLRAEKTLRSIRYALEHFTFNLLLKVDTDSWVFMDRLLAFVDEKKLWDKKGVYAGNFDLGRNVHVVSDPSAKWYDSLYPKLTGMQVYPTHAKGAGYMLSRDLCEFIGERRSVSLAYLPSEDVSVGFWLNAVNHTKVPLRVSVKPECLALPLSHAHGEGLLSLDEEKGLESAMGNMKTEDEAEMEPRREVLASGLVVDHYITPEVMAERWRAYSLTGEPCIRPSGLELVDAVSPGVALPPRPPNGRAVRPRDGNS